MDLYKKNDGHKNFLCEVNQEKNHLLEHAVSQLVNNPSISIIPIKSNQHTSASTKKRSPVSTSNKGFREPSPISVIVLDSVENTTKNLKTKEIENSFKRIATNPISTRSEKLLKFSTELPKKDCEEVSVYSHLNKVSEFNQLKNDKIKKINSKYVTSGVTPISTLSSINRVPPEYTSQKHKKKPTNIDLNCKLDSVNIDETDKSISPKQNQKADGFNFDERDRQNSRKVLKIEYNGQSIATSNTQMISDFVLALQETMEKNTDRTKDKDLQPLINFLLAKSSKHGHT